MRDKEKQTVRDGGIDEQKSAPVRVFDGTVWLDLHADKLVVGHGRRRVLGRASRVCDRGVG